MMRLFLFVGVVLLFNPSNINGQKSEPTTKSMIYPKVFKIGDNPSAFESLGDDYEKLLVHVYDNDMKKAHLQWMDLLRAMEKFAEEENFDLKGIKLWLKVFWNTDGRIEHIAFHLKPNSKNIKEESIQRFLSQFIISYKGRMTTSTVKFSQYSSASFPTLPQLVIERD